MDRPILFSAHMVRALLAGTKTQTRRVVKLPHMNPLGQWEPVPWGGPNGGRTAHGKTVPAQTLIWHSRTGEILGCPYGQPGDSRLWVREAWRTADTLDKLSPAGIADASLAAGYSTPWAPLQFEADGKRNGAWPGFGPGNGVAVGAGKLRPGIHMPRWASRITLEVTEVRVQRLQDISEADARAEGCDPLIWDGVEGTAADLIDWPLKETGPGYRNAYALLWEAINGDGSWAANPWVWVISFKRAQQ